MRRLSTFLVLAMLVLAAGAACGGGDNNNAAQPAPPPAATGTGGGTALALAADPGGALAFDQTTLEAPAGTVTIDFTNDSSTPHNVTVDGPNVEDEATDTITQSSATLTLADLQPGTYTFYCSVDGHRAAGMEGTLTIK